MKRGGSLSFLVGTISNVLVMEIGWTDMGNGGYILVNRAHSNTRFFYSLNEDRVSYHNLPTFKSYHVSECLPYHITCRYNLQKFTCKYYHFHYSIKYNDTKKKYAILRLKGKQEKMEDMGNNTF